MKKSVKSVLTVILSFSAVMISNITIAEASETKSINMYYNNTKIEEEQPFIEDGRTYIPIREVSDLLGVEISYDNNTKTVVLSDDKTTAEFIVNNRYYTVNDVLYEADVASVMKNNTVYLPLRVVSEAFGGNIYINDETNSIILDFDASNKNIQTNEEMISEIKQETLNLYVEVIKSDEFKAFEKVLVKSEEFKEFIYDVTKTDSFEHLLVDLYNTEEFIGIYKYIYELESYQTYASDVMQLESYKELLNEYGNNAFANGSINVNLIVEDFDLFSEIISSPKFATFLIECKELESYKEFMLDLEKTQDVNIKKFIKEVVFTSENFINLMLEASEIEENIGLFDNLKNTPEGKEVINLYEEVETVILEKYLNN